MKLKLTPFLLFILLSANLFAQDVNLSEIIERNRAKTSQDNISLADPSGAVYTLGNLKINTENDEMTSHLYLGKFIFACNKKIGFLKSNVDPETNKPYDNLYCGDIDKENEVKHVMFFSSIINENGANETSASFAENGLTVYFSRTEIEDGKSQIKLFRGEMTERGWGNITKLPLNQKGYNFTTPYVSPDGSKLFFASNMPGTYGGYDIFVCNIDPQGNISTPENVGNHINTTKDEIYPYILEDNLYISSNGHKGLGGFDIFEIDMVNGKLMSPKNMGSSLNSKADDFGFLFKDPEHGYLTSNRAGGKGNYDIYKFKRKIVNQYLSIQTQDSLNLLSLNNTDIVVKDLYGNLITEGATNTNGMFTFETKPNQEYEVTVSKDGYITQVIHIETPRTEEGFTYKTNIYLAPVKIEVEEKSLLAKIIYFDFDKYKIVGKHKKDLNEIIDALNENTSYTLILNARCDIRGTEAYNDGLGSRRANSTLKYLKRKGVSEDRIIIHNYGELNPLAPCMKEHCTEEEHQENRSVQLIIEDNTNNEVL